MSVWEVVHAFLERSSCMSEKGFMFVLKLIHVCLGRGSCLFGRGSCRFGKGLCLSSEGFMSV